MQRALIVIGALLIVLGLAWPWLSRLGLGRLPGDIRIETESGGFYFPIVTCLIISVALTLILWFCAARACADLPWRGFASVRHLLFVVLMSG